MATFTLHPEELRLMKEALIVMLASKYRPENAKSATIILLEDMIQRISNVLAREEIVERKKLEKRINGKKSAYEMAQEAMRDAERAVLDRHQVRAVVDERAASKKSGK